MSTIEIPQEQEDFVDAMFNFDGIEKEEPKEVISEPKVMRSAAGYYVGRSCTDDECPGLEIPYDRLSGYFPTHEMTAAFMKEYSLMIQQRIATDWYINNR